MNAKLKKVITSLILIVMLFNLIGGKCLAVNSDGDASAASDEDTVLESIGGTAFAAVDGVVGILTTKVRVIVVLITSALQGITSLLGHVDDSFSNVANGENGNVMITVEEIFFNKLNITKINFFDMGSDAGDISSKFRQNVAIWYYVLRNLAIIILLCILIYVGIRMAVSTVASEKAMYKNMFKDWVVSFILVFFMHYIIVVTIQVNSSLVDIMKPQDEAGWGADYMNTLFLNAVGVNTAGLIPSAIKSWASAIIYAMMIFFTLAFLWTYVKRMITLAFLIVISPLVTVTYAIDKMGDGKSQALNTWLKEFIYNVLLQPFQCVTYLALMKTTIQNLTDSKASLGMGALAIMCMMFIFSAEKIVRKIFGFDKASTISDTMATTAAMISTASNLKNVGPKGRTPAGKAAGKVAKNTANTTNAALAKNNIASKNIDKMKQVASNAVSKQAQNISDSVSAVANKVATTPLGRAASAVSAVASAAGQKISQMPENLKREGERWAASNNKAKQIIGNATIASVDATKTLGNNVKKDIKGAVGSVGDAVKNINSTAGATQAAMTMMGVAAGLTTGNVANAVTYGITGNEIGSKMAMPFQDRYREKQEERFASNYKDIAGSLDQLDENSGKYDLSTDSGKENMKDKAKEVSKKGTYKVNQDFQNSYNAYKESIMNDLNSDPVTSTLSDKVKQREVNERSKRMYENIINGDMNAVMGNIAMLKATNNNDQADALKNFAMAAKEKELLDNIARMEGIEEALGDSDAEKTVVTGENSTIDRINEGMI